jgi:hypothetical protein
MIQPVFQDQEEQFSQSQWNTPTGILAGMQQNIFFSSL